jgi:N-acetylneuraminic acid mutarotase
MSQHKHFVILFGLCTTLAACDTAAPTDPTEPVAEAAGADPQSVSNMWVVKQSLTPFRRAMAAGTINGILYVAGGLRADQRALARVDAYNVAANTWSMVASLPMARVEPHGATMIGGKLYVSGGRNANGMSTRTLFVYDPTANMWTRKADVPQTGCGGTQGVVNGQLYVYTGCYTEEKSGVMFRYDPATNTWLQRAAPPTAHKGGAGGVINGKFYLVGGWKTNPCAVNGEPTICDELDNALHVYDPMTNSWMAKAHIPVKREGISAVAMNGKLFVVGGVTEIGGYDTWVYDPGTNTWTRKAPLPRVLSDGAAAMAGGKLVYVGGGEQQPAAPGPSRVYVYNP